MIRHLSLKETVFDDVNRALNDALNLFTLNNLLLNSNKTKCVRFTMLNSVP